MYQVEMCVAGGWRAIGAPWRDLECAIAFARGLASQLGCLTYCRYVFEKKT
jgi:hypothetical protein